MFLQTKYGTSAKQKIVKLSPLIVLLVLTTSIFISHFVVMFYRSYSHHPYYFPDVLIESFLFIIVIFPSLYFLVFQPLLKQINEKEEAKNELKKNETELITAKEKALESDRMKSEFIAQMSHEIRTPLNTIMSFSKMIKEDPANKISEEFSNEVDAIDAASKRIIRSIDLILNLSEIESDSYFYNPEPLDVYEDVLLNLYEEYKDIAARKGLVLKLERNAHNPVIVADKHDVAQIFSNLIDNAIKFTEKGSVEIKVYDDPENGLTVSIIDTGIGISEHFVHELFKPFTQEDHGYSRKFDGMGLGLTLVERYCKINKAKIEVNSVVSKGSTFTVTFCE